MDAVFLAAACPAAPGDRVLEAGCGTGVALLCLLTRIPNIRAVGVEVDAELAALAEENTAANGFAGIFEAVVADVGSDWRQLEGAGLCREGYDHVMANPPFYSQGEGRASKHPQNARARAMGQGGIEVWLRFLASAAKPGGTCTIIYTAAGLPELLNAFGTRFGGLRVLPLYPRAGAPAIRIIVRGTKGSRAPLSIESGFILHDADGAQTEAAQAILRDAAKLN